MTGSYQGIKTTIKVSGLLLCTMATSFCSYGQEINDDFIDTLLDDLFFNEQQFLDEFIENDTSYNFIYATVSYNSSTYFSGRDTGTDQFNITPQISYYHSSGFNASISGIYYQEFLPTWDFTSLSLGYFNTLGKHKNWSYNLGYTKYFYADGYDTFTNSLDVSVGLRNKKRTIGTTVAASYIFGVDTSYQIVSSNFINFTIKRSSNFGMRIRPSLNFIIAKQSLAIEKMMLVANERVRTTVNFNVFNLLNTQVSIPFSITTKSWDFEFGYTLNFPNAVFKEESMTMTSFFSFSIGYLFNLSR